MLQTILTFLIIAMTLVFVIVRFIKALKPHKNGFYKCSGCDSGACSINSKS